MTDVTGPLRRAMETIRTLRAELAAARGATQVAVVGMSLRAPGCVNDRASFWATLTQGRDLTGPLPAERAAAFPGQWDKLQTRGCYLEGAFGFEPKFFGLSAPEARAMDPQHRLLLEGTWLAFEDAGITPDSVGASTGVYVGITGQDYRDWAHAPSASWTVGNGHCFAAGRIANVLGFGGPALAVDTACSSSLTALHLACRALAAGDCDVAVVGGVNLVLSPRSTLEISRTGALSDDGRCRPFDARANGFARGEGCGVFVLKRVTDAHRDADRVLAVVRATGLNQDGRGTGFTAPNVHAQSSLVASVLADASLQPTDIGYVEAHGTGTPLGDPIEMEALIAALRKPSHPVFVSSVKGHFGHTEAAAGAFGMAKAIMCLRERAIPPQHGFTALNPRIDLSGTGLTVPTTMTPLATGTHAAVSSFGASGTNAHVVIGLDQPRQAPTASPTGFLVSAFNEPALRALADAYADVVSDVDYAGFCYTTTFGRTRLPCAWWVSAGDNASARDALTAVASGRQHPAVGEPGAAPELPRHVVDLPGYPWQRKDYVLSRGE
ncbi:beta-ketoacyl synthase N-terminal-like domain-containing protein [Actinophytocola sp.]|uniref:beta-ketoacyl synthase N-terminal-like domain-containing protein n=1 Tax=Actinophytocola sp. TaxID=1872138 RepID=UPI00389B1953